MQEEQDQTCNKMQAVFPCGNILHTMEFITCNIQDILW